MFVDCAVDIDFAVAAEILFSTVDIGIVTRDVTKIEAFTNEAANIILLDVFN